MLDPLALERVLRAKWSPIAGVHDVSVRPHAGRWAIVVSGPAPSAPPQITATVRVDVGDRVPAVLQVFWRRVEASSPRQLPLATVTAPNDADQSLWAGASDVRPRAVRMIQPIDTAPGLAMGTKIPGARLEAYQFFLPMRTPSEPFFSRPYTKRGCACCNDLNLDRLVFTSEVGADEQLIIQSVSYDCFDVPVSNQFRFRLTSNGSEIARWEDIVVSTTDGPAHQFAMCGHLRPMELNCYIDHNATIGLYAQLLGPYPFTSPPSYSTDAQICITVNGLVCKLNDTRQGVPRPADLGDLNDVAQGYKDILKGVTDAEIAEVLAVLNQGQYEIDHPVKTYEGLR